MGVASKKRRVKQGKRPAGRATGARGRVAAAVAQVIPLPARVVGKGVLKGAGAVVGFVQRRRAAGKVGFAAGLKRRRRGIVPKAVKKYVARMVRKRKQENKVITKLLSVSGAKRMFGGSKAGSKGSITAKEAMAALAK